MNEDNVYGILGNPITEEEAQHKADMLINTLYSAINYDAYCVFSRAEKNTIPSMTVCLTWNDLCNYLSTNIDEYSRTHNLDVYYVWKSKGMEKVYGTNMMHYYNDCKYTYTMYTFEALTRNLYLKYGKIAWSTPLESAPKEEPEDE